MAVIALLDPIRMDIERGRPLRDIYREHEATLSVTYVQFTKLVRRYLDVVPLSKRARQSGPASKSILAPTPELPVLASPPSPPPGSKEWRKLHGTDDTSGSDEGYVARVPDIDYLIHGTRNDPKE